MIVYLAGHWHLTRHAWEGYLTWCRWVGLDPHHLRHNIDGFIYAWAHRTVHPECNVAPYC